VRRLRKTGVAGRIEIAKPLVAKKITKSQPRRLWAKTRMGNPD
jgi:hypothetical protein